MARQFHGLALPPAGTTSRHDVDCTVALTAGRRLRVVCGSGAAEAAGAPPRASSGLLCMFHAVALDAGEGCATC
eukprot:11721831-Alexandrium_andersonii.AAC.1